MALNFAKRFQNWQRNAALWLRLPPSWIHSFIKMQTYIMSGGWWQTIIKRKYTFGFVVTLTVLLYLSIQWNFICFTSQSQYIIGKQYYIQIAKPYCKCKFNFELQFLRFISLLLPTLSL